MIQEGEKKSEEKENVNVAINFTVSKYFERRILYLTLLSTPLFPFFANLWML
ncbi:MAG: hypothetical protein JWN98_1399 [Abditibacteriota bacterium]|nr:hypothetical protein [Abditibacteriota bacterium]